ncbi:AraC family transcriptional regulator ligand-binding domain-containing protein, partial [Acinetobacter baumannii]
AFFCDEAFASMITCLNMMLGDRRDLVHLELSYDHSAYLDEYQKIFNCPILFNANKNLIRFNSTILTRTLKNHSPVNFQSAIQICEQALKQF